MFANKGFVFAAAFLALALTLASSEDICDCEEKPKCPTEAPKDCGGGRGLLMVPGGEDCSCCEAVCPRTKGESCEGPHSLACDHGLVCGDAGVCTEETSLMSGAQLTALSANDTSLTLGWKGPPGYVIQYREIEEGAGNKNDSPWKKFEKMSEASEWNFTITDLKPERSYEARAILPGPEGVDQGRLGEPEAAVRAEVGCSCPRPFFRIGTVRGDSGCNERPMAEKPCCVLVVCADSQTSETETHSMVPRVLVNAPTNTTTAAPMNTTTAAPMNTTTEKMGMNKTEAAMEKCTHKNETLSMGEVFHDGCEQKCTCEAGGKVSCKPRCEEMPHNISSKCFSIPDPQDVCCTKVLCDVTLGDQDTNPGVQAESKGSSDAASTTMLPSTHNVGKDGCTYNGRTYAIDQEFHDGCRALCICSHDGEVECAPIHCPTDSGLDVLDPHCVTWEPVPMEPGEDEGDSPTCCPEVRCKDNGSCEYAGQRFDNFAEIPASVSEGCSGHRCFCEFGNVTCGGGAGVSKCHPLPPHAPANLQCLGGGPGSAILAHPPGDNCCLAWMCPEDAHLGNKNTDFGHPPPPPSRFPDMPLHPHLHPQLHNVGVSSASDEIAVDAANVQPDSSVHLVFSLPSLFVGLHGQVEISYTQDPLKEDPETWEGKEIVSTPGDLIQTQRLEYTIPAFNGKTGLQPNKVYRIRIMLLLRDLRNSPSSRIITVHTPSGNQVNTTQLPAQIEVDAELGIAEVNSTWARFVWRKFNDFELQFIDGVQLRYKEIEGKVYSTTQLLHRATVSYTLEGLRPSSTYEVSLLLVPFPDQKTELIARETLHITTAAEKDPYGFDLKIKVDNIKVFSAEVSWSGVPYPEDKYVNIFRVIYQSDSAGTKGGEGSEGGPDGEERSSTFKVAKRDPSPSALVTGLKPGTRYRMWLEAYLTNGRIKKSDVKDIVTKPSSSSSTKQGKLEASVGEVGKKTTEESGDYYGGLVGVSILAALAFVAILILLLMLLKRQGQAKKAAISTARKSESAYDNPTYKTSDHDSTNGRIKNSARLQEA